MKQQKHPKFLEDFYQPKSILKLPNIKSKDNSSQSISDQSSHKKSQFKFQNSPPERQSNLNNVINHDESLINKPTRRLHPLNTKQFDSINEKILSIYEGNQDEQGKQVQQEIEHIVKKVSKSQKAKPKPLVKLQPLSAKQQKFSKLSDQQHFFLKLKQKVLDQIDHSIMSTRLKDPNQSLSLQFQDLNETLETATNTACNQTSLLHLDQTLNEELNEQSTVLSVLKKPKKWFQRKKELPKLEKQQSRQMSSLHRATINIPSQQLNYSIYYKKISLQNDLQITTESQKIFQDIKEILAECLLWEFDSSKSYYVLLNIENLLKLSSEIKLPSLHLSLLELNGISLYALGDYKKAINIFKFYRNLCIFKNFKKEKMRGYKLLFIVYSLMKNHIQACIYLKKWLKHAWENEDIDEELLVYDHLGVYFYYQGDIVTAKYFHERSIEGHYEPEDSVLRKIGINQLQLKRQQKLQQYHSRLQEKKTIQTDVEFNSNGMHLAESIFTDSEDEYNLEVFQMLSKIDENNNNCSNEEKKQGACFTKKTKTVLNHDRKPNFQLPEETVKYGISYLNPQYFKSRIPISVTNCYAPKVNNSDLQNHKNWFYKKHERLINKFRTEDIQKSFDNNKLSMIKHNVQNNTYFYRISHLSCNRDLLNYSKNLAENCSGKDFTDQMNVRFQPIEKIKIFEILRSLASQIDKYLEFITVKLNEQQSFL